MQASRVASHPHTRIASAHVQHPLTSSPPRLPFVTTQVEPRRLHVAAPGCAPLELDLPLSVSAQGARAELAQTAQGGVALHVRLPFQPLRCVLQHARSSAQAELDLEGCGVLEPL